ncbi:MAG: dihydroorotase, partial [Clostridiales bacterium]
MLIKNATVVDPSQALHQKCDIRIVEGAIVEVAPMLSAAADERIIEAAGNYVLPGLFDMHVHLREPGQEHKEDIASGTAAAARGGVTGVLAMPNTTPTVESRAIVEDVQRRIAEKAKVQVELTGSITKGLRGEELSDIAEMIDAGIIAITDDGRTTMSEDFMIQAYQIIEPHDLVLISHSEDHDIVDGGAVHAGKVSADLGIKGIPPEVECNIVKRDIALAEQTGAKLHIAHISTKQSIAAVRDAQKRGLPITAEACPHHFCLTDEILYTAGNLAKVNPPIRSEEHRAAVEAGLLDGTISCIVTDHAPHTLEEKAGDIYKAPFGISGVELSLSLSYTHFVKSGKLTIDRLVELMAIQPRQLLNLKVPQIKVGESANLVIFNPNVERVIRAADMVSRGKNIPYEGMTVSGDVKMTFYDGAVVYEE